MVHSTSVFLSAPGCRNTCRYGVYQNTRKLAFFTSHTSRSARAQNKSQMYSSSEANYVAGPTRYFSV